ncbi:hypothetical protein ROZALSC1DRAFT_23978, partial [Rozella allomycis CSF55]
RDPGPFFNEKKYLQRSSRAQKEERVFNSEEDAFLLSSSRKFRQSFKSTRQQAHLILNEKENEFNNIIHFYIDPQYRASEFVALLSLPGCPSQAVHRDYFDYKKSLMDHYGENYPIGAILALDDNTKLNVFKGSPNEISAIKKSNMKNIDIAKGSIIFFSGFFPHSGSSYDNENMRVHFLCSHLDHNVDTVATSIVDFVDDESSDTDYETIS